MLRLCSINTRGAPWGAGWTTGPERNGSRAVSPSGLEGPERAWRGAGGAAASRPRKVGRAQASPGPGARVGPGRAGQSKPDGPGLGQRRGVSAGAHQAPGRRGRLLTTRAAGAVTGPSTRLCLRGQVSLQGPADPGLDCRSQAANPPSNLSTLCTDERSGENL